MYHSGKHTLVRTNRIGAYDRRYYSGQHRHHRVNLQGLNDLFGLSSQLCGVGAGDAVRS